MNKLFNFFKQKESILIYIIILGVILICFKKNPGSTNAYNENELVKAKKNSFDIEVKAIGELEAANSISIASLIRGENGKIISIIADGTNVNTGDLLIKMDPTPFEEKLENLMNKRKEQESYVASLQKSLDWEVSQAERDDKTSEFEVEAAELELTKVIKGDGPLEIARLKGAMQKAFIKFEEINGYSSDLLQLQEEGFLNPSELKNAHKKLEEEKEAYETAKLQYESYVDHVYPMHVKRAEAALKQAKMKKEETIKIRSHAIGKAMVELSQAIQVSEGMEYQYLEAEKELALTEIKAPSSGMVVHKEDFRNGLRRKPRLGDVAVKNQVLLDLPDLSQMTVKSKVREIDLCKIDLGKNVIVEIDAYPQLHFTGKVTLIGTLALAELGKPAEEKYFEIRVLLDKSDPKLRPGMTSRITIQGDKLQDVLTVPVHALFYEQQKSYCYVSTFRGYEKREVKSGVSNEEWVQIHDGLNEGDYVCITMPTELQS